MLKSTRSFYNQLIDDLFSLANWLVHTKQTNTHSFTMHQWFRLNAKPHSTSSSVNSVNNPWNCLLITPIYSLTPRVVLQVHVLCCITHPLTAQFNTVFELRSVSLFISGYFHKRERLFLQGQNGAVITYL